MTVSIALPWLILAVVILVVGAVFATLRWSSRITRGQHAFYDNEFSVYALARQVNSATRADEPRRPRRSGS